MTGGRRQSLVSLGFMYALCSKAVLHLLINRGVNKTVSYHIFLFPDVAKGENSVMHVSFFCSFCILCYSF